jgi:DNA-binding NarL/FixJ family response regulator
MECSGDPERTSQRGPLRVVLADDHAGFRRGLMEMLSTDGGIEVVGEAENGQEAVALVAEAVPDVVVLDLAMPVMGGKEATGLILRAVSPPPGIIILTMYDHTRLAHELLGLGASALLPKSASLAQIVAAVKVARPSRPSGGASDDVPPVVG